MFKRSLCLVAVAAAAMLVVGRANATNNNAVTMGNVYEYGALFDPSGTKTNFIISAYMAPNGVSGRLNWVVENKMYCAVNASHVVFDSPSHVTMSGDFSWDGAPAHFVLSLTKPGFAGKWGSIGLQITSNTDGHVYYATGVSTTLAVQELPLYSSGGSWFVR